MQWTQRAWQVPGQWRILTTVTAMRQGLARAEARGAWQPVPPKEQRMSLVSQQVPGFALGLFRMMFGVLWLEAALKKAPWVINAQGNPFGWLSNWIWQEIQHPTFDFYKRFLELVVFPNNTLNPFFGYMTFIVEMALGISLLLGALTVLSGLGGALWQLNIAVGSFSVPGEWYWIWPLLIVPHLVFASSQAGRVLGLDYYLRPWLANAPWGDTRLGRLLLRCM